MLNLRGKKLFGIGAVLILGVVTITIGIFVLTQESPSSKLRLGAGGITQVQKAADGGVNGIDVTLSSTPTVGNVLIAAHFTRATTASATGFTAAVTVNNSTEADQLVIWYRVVQSGDGTTWHFGNDVDWSAVILFEYSGLDTSSLLDKTASTGRTTSATSLSTGSTATTSVADELLIGAMGIRGDVSSQSWDSSFVDEGNQTAGNPGAGDATVLGATRVVTSTAAYSSTASWTTSVTAMGAIATFQAPVAAASAAPTSRRRNPPPIIIQ